MKRAEKREHLIDVAAELFNRHGYHAAGVDRVIAEAGIAKTTLYRHFASKDELIVAVLDRIDRAFRERMRKAVDEAATDPAQKILASFDFLESWFSEDSFYGCPFVSAAGEFAERSSPVFQEALMHKRLVIAYFEELARAAQFEDPEEIADTINLLHEGAIAVAQVSGKPEAARHAKKIASQVIHGSKRAANAATESKSER